MTITMNYWEIDEYTDVIAGGSTIDYEVTDEQFETIKASYETGKYQYMTDDEELKDIVALFYGEAYEPMIETYGKNIYMVIAFEYPNEIRKGGN